MRAAVALRKAERALRDYGWVQGEMGDPVYGFCAYGAVKHVTWSHPIARRRALNHLRKTIGSGIISWNDDPFREKREVLWAFTAAVADVEGRSVPPKPVRGTSLTRTLEWYRRALDHMMTEVTIEQSTTEDEDRVLVDA